MHSRLVRAVLLVAGPVLVSCKDDGTSPPPKQIEITPATASTRQLLLRDTVHLTAAVVGSSSASTFVWESSDTNVIKVGSDGIAEVIGLGAAKITARVADAADPTKAAANGPSGSIVLQGSPWVFHPGPVKDAAISSDQQCVVLSTGAAQCRGKNNVGQVGTGSVSPLTAPVAAWTPVVGGQTFKTISVALSSTCALTVDLKAYCWGSNGRGQLGTGTTLTPVNSPTPMEFGVNRGWVQFEVRGHDTACGVSTSDVPLCVGHNDFGQVGRLPKSAADTLIGEYGSGHVASMIRTSNFMTCVLRTDGQVYCTGYAGAATNSTASGSIAEPSRIGGDVVFKSITVGYWHGCGLDVAGVAYCWGYNEEGQLGDGTTTASGTARPVAGGLTFSKIYALGFGNCGVSTAGDTWCWGGNSSAFGRTNLDSSSVPVRVNNGRGASHISALGSELGGPNVCAIDLLSRLVCWGPRPAGLTDESLGF